MAFYDSEEHYGTRKLKVVLRNKGIIVSRRKIGVIMKKHGLVSTYTIKDYKVKKGSTSERAENILNHEFDNAVKHDVIVSDLTLQVVGIIFVF